MVWEWGKEDGERGEGATAQVTFTSLQDIQQDNGITNDEVPCVASRNDYWKDNSRRKGQNLL